MSIDKNILNWYANGQIGLSSKTMATHFSGAKITYADYPHDPSDFNRCLLFLEAVPEANIKDMATVSNTWSLLVKNWEKLEKCFIDEVGRNWSKARSAPKTYKLMESILRA